MDENTKLVVVDSSFVLARILPDEKPMSIVFETFRKFNSGELMFVAPTLLKYEVTNSLKSSVLQKRVDQKTAQKILTKFLKLKVKYEEVDFSKTFEISIKHNISAYDAAYVYLSKLHQVPLLSLDQKLTQI